MRVLVVSVLLGACGSSYGSDDPGLPTPDRDGGASDAASDGGSDAVSSVDAPMSCRTSPFGAPAPFATGLASSFDELGAWPFPTVDSLYVGRATAGQDDGHLYLFAGGMLAPLVVPSASEQRYPSLTADGLTLFFVNEATSSPALYVTHRADASSTSFSNTQPLFAGNITTTPYVAGNQLWFSLRGSGFEWQIAVAALDGSGNPGPKSVVTGLGSDTVNDLHPVLTADGLRLYFSSDRNSANYDVWMAERPTKNDPFGAAVVVKEVNGTADDHPLWISPDECTLLLQTSRAGNYDIYVAKR